MTYWEIMIATTATVALSCLALNIYHESRSEPIRGQLAVALVTMNRADWKIEEVCDEVVRPKQFSWTEQKVRIINGTYKLKQGGIPREKEAWLRSVNLARKVLNGKVHDFTNGSKFYHTIKNRTPKWARKMLISKIIGNHIFYTGDLFDIRSAKTRRCAS
jgi:N-acetylmuramoyl-L-alanine amidase